MSGGFTKGPWVAEPDSFDDFSIHPVGRALAVAAVVNGGINAVTGHGDEHKANAHLIAAAPEMYEALEAMRARWELYIGGLGGAGHTDDALMKQAAAALAKARGEAK